MKTIQKLPSPVQIFIRADIFNWSWFAIQENQLIAKEAGRFKQAQPLHKAERFAFLKSQALQIKLGLQKVQVSYIPPSVRRPQ